ncbi:unnamed protein product [Pleuronectes platessa]|uniref:Uncharacterized protein n=1 Tax=Pleuronectes platessa TaxID=8262 RepID=A0A9N7UH59_PLEPL|nr:unnamed protein product [Pleuronectes platessa]
MKVPLSERPDIKGGCNQLAVWLHLTEEAGQRAAAYISTNLSREEVASCSVLCCELPLSKAPYSPNNCSPGAVHGRSPDGSKAEAALFLIRAIVLASFLYLTDSLSPSLPFFLTPLSSPPLSPLRERQPFLPRCQRARLTSYCLNQGAFSKVTSPSS